MHCEIDRQVSLVVYHDPNLKDGNLLRAVMIDQWMPFRVLHEHLLDLGLSKYRRKSG